jgi:hypothetical protein
MAAFVTSLLQMGRVNLTEALGDVPEADVVSSVPSVPSVVNPASTASHT